MDARPGVADHVVAVRVDYSFELRLATVIGSLVLIFMLTLVYLGIKQLDLKNKILAVCYVWPLNEDKIFIYFLEVISCQDYSL